MEQDHYAILGVAPAAEQPAIRAAYRALMRRYHPDADASAEAAEQARAINRAYAVLRDPEQRSRYDGSLESRRPLRFEPADESLDQPGGTRIAPALAVGVTLFAAGMVAFAIMPPTEPLPFGSSPQRVARPVAKAAHAETAPADPSTIERLVPVILPPVAPKEVLAGVEETDFPITPEPVMKPPLPAEPTAPLKRKLMPDTSGAALPKPASVQPASATASCPAAVHRADRLMCSDTNLASLDRQLTLLYRQSYEEADERKRAALLGTRQRFNDRRDSCSSSNCLTTAYVVRLKEISDIMAGRGQP